MGRKHAGRKTIAWMAWKGLIARRKRAGLNFMTVVSVSGVAIGVATLIIVLSVMGGFENDLQDKMMSGQPHLELTSEHAGVGLSLKTFPLSEVHRRVPEARGVNAFVQADVVAKHGKHYSSLTIFGVDPSHDSGLWAFSSSMTVGQLKDIGERHPSYLDSGPSSEKWPGIVLGDKLATQLGVDMGDEVTVISPEANTSSALAGGTLSRRYVVVGKFVTGMFNFDARWAVVSIPEARKFMPSYDPSLDEDDYVTGIALNVPDPMHIDVIAKRFQGVSGVRPLTWLETNKTYLFALKLEKFTMGSVLMLIVLVAAFSISATMMMTVYHKRSHVALLRAIGMTNGDVARLFLFHGFAIGVVGVAFGVLVGVSVCVFVHFMPGIPLPAGVYYLKSLPVKFLPVDYCVISVAALALSIAAAAYPAITASRQDPVDGLRCE